MSGEMLTWIWLAVGVVLIVGEAVLPGLVSIFGGFAALFVALLTFLGITTSPVSQALVWMALSVVLVATLRKAARKAFAGDVRTEDIDEARMHYGREVEVVETLSDTQEGRIRYQGSSWKAVSTGPELQPGDKARLVFQDNLTWVVEPLSAAEHDDDPKQLTDGTGQDLLVPDSSQQTEA